MSKVRITIITLSVLAIVATAIFMVFPSSSTAKADPGVVACQDMADRQASGKKSSGNMTEEAYHQARAPFENSTHSDIKTAGLNFVDSVWESQKALNTDDTDIATSFGILTKIEARYASLQIACGNHGVTLKSLTT